MLKRLLAPLFFLIALALVGAPAQAQVFIVANCGTVPASQATLTAGRPGMLFIDTTGRLCQASTTTTADGGSAALGATTDAVCATATGTCSLIALLKLQNNAAINGIGITTTFVNATNTTNATLLKNSAGRVFDLYLSNLTATPSFFKLYDKATAPTPGTDVPVMVIPIAANATSTINAFTTHGVQFTNGIAFATTGLIGDADSTAVGARSVVGAIVWK